MRDVHLGPQYAEREMEGALRKYGLSAVYRPGIASAVAELIAEGKIVGWFQGRMEFGPRALGNRSILADPRREEMKDILNERVKHRENFRPFAPSVLKERAAEYFDTNGHEAPFMVLVFPIHTAKRGEIPAVTHVDGTARIQTVDKEVNPRYWELIHEFEKISGVPVVINTSFNVRGEPIVCSPEDAIKCFLGTGIDYLALGNFLVSKP
jgi:carbamoyltransferase